MRFIVLIEAGTIIGYQMRKQDIRNSIHDNRWIPAMLWGVHLQLE